MEEIHVKRNKAKRPSTGFLRDCLMRLRWVASSVHIFKWNSE
jgi:hypothetical protein